MNSHAFFKTRIAIAIIAMFALSVTARANTFLNPIIIEPIETTEIKAIQVVSQITTQKPSYQVGEPIRFNIKNDKNAYVYILSNDNLGRTVLIYPNNKEKNNFLMAHQAYVLPSPNQSVDFVSDKVGVEKFTIITSLRPLNFNDILNAVQGNYQVGQTQQIWDMLASIGIIVNDRNTTHAKDGIVITNLQVPITNQNTAPPVVGTPSYQSQPSATKISATGVVMMATHKSTYVQDEVITINYVGSSYGLNAQLLLGIRYNNGTIKIINTSQADGRLQNYSFKADPNIGQILLWEGNNQDVSMAASLHLNIQ